MPLWGTHEIIKVPERGGSILVKYTKRLFKFANFQMFIILSKRLVWFYIFVYIIYSFKARCSIEFAGAVNKKYYSVRQISRIQYKLTGFWVIYIEVTVLQKPFAWKHVAFAAHRTEWNSIYTTLCTARRPWIRRYKWSIIQNSC